MSFSLAIKDGDLQVKGSAIGIVQGVDKLYQDLSIWLRERFRSDRFHLNYGSTLDAYIGGVIDPGTVAEVRAEVMRVLQNYQSLQHRRLQTEPNLLSAAEILYSVDDVAVRVEYDSVIVTVRFTNASGTGGQITTNAGSPA